MRRDRPLAAAAGALAALTVAAAPAAALGTETFERVSVSTGGVQQNLHANRAYAPVLTSDNGRWVAFSSAGDTLVPGDTASEDPEAFLRDRVAGTTVRIGVASDGTPGDAESVATAMSRDGRRIAFRSDADNLVPGDTNGTTDVFLHDRITGTTERVSVGDGGQQGDDASGATGLVAGGVSDDGRYVAFTSFATNLAAGDTTPDWDLFLRDRVGGRTHFVSYGVGGNIAIQPMAAMSRDARRFAFVTADTHVIPGDANGTEDVFWRDLVTGVTKPVSVTTAGRPSGLFEGSGDPAMSADGRHVAFTSYATNFGPPDVDQDIDVFVRDVAAGITRQASVAADGDDVNDAASPTISGDGRYVTFSSLDGDVMGDGLSGAYRRDMLTNRTTRIRRTPTGDPAHSFVWSTSADGRHLGVQGADELVSGPGNGVPDAFAADFAPIGATGDPYADEVAPGDTATVTNPAAALGAPDGALATIAGTNDTHATWLMDDPGTGDLTLHLGGGRSTATRPTVEFIGPTGLLLSRHSVGSFSSSGRASVVVPYAKPAPYRAIRLRTGTATLLHLDALEADGIAPW